MIIYSCAHNNNYYCHYSIVSYQFFKKKTKKKVTQISNLHAFNAHYLIIESSDAITALARELLGAEYFNINYKMM